MPLTRRGSAFIFFSTSTLIPSKSKPMLRALMPITVIMHVASEVASRSVGEKRSPLPLLSVGASVSKEDWERKWVHSVLNSPLYNTEDVIVVFWYKFTRQYRLIK